MSRATWTAREIATLSERLVERVPAREIASELGRTLRSVQCRIDRTGIGRGRTGRERDPSRAALILDALARGLSASAVARLLGVGPNAVLKTIRALARQGLVSKAGTRRNAPWVVNRRRWVPERERP